jgi:hypothetical protein
MIAGGVQYFPVRVSVSFYQLVQNIFHNLFQLPHNEPAVPTVFLLEMFGKENLLNRFL